MDLSSTYYVINGQKTILSSDLPVVIHQCEGEAAALYSCYKGGGVSPLFPQFCTWRGGELELFQVHLVIASCQDLWLSNIKRWVNAYTNWCMLSHLQSKHAAQTGLTERWSNWVLHLLWFQSFEVHITKELWLFKKPLLSIWCLVSSKWAVIAENEKLIIEALILAATLQIFTFFCWFCCPASAASGLCIPLWWHHDGKGASQMLQIEVFYKHQQGVVVTFVKFELKPPSFTMLSSLVNIGVFCYH